MIIVLFSSVPVYTFRIQELGIHVRNKFVA